MRAILVSVEYDDLLSITLPRNRKFFSEVMIVTTHSDLATHELAYNNDCKLHCTNSFYTHNAIFNKWIALEEGLTKFGRHGLMCVMDSDILWPDVAGYLDDAVYRPGCLYTPQRYVLPEPTEGIPPENEWEMLPRFNDIEWAGYTQIFHADDPVLAALPWYQTNWSHAGGADSYFQGRWDVGNKLRPVWECLHLGLPGRNWCGRVTPRIDGGQLDANKVEDRRQALRQIIWQRYSNLRKPDPYMFEKLS
jgi:hypothetical protein